MQLRNNILFKISCIFTICILLFSSSVAFASTGNGIAPCAYYDDNTFTFTGSKATTKAYDGTYMALEFSATSSTGVAETITISVYIDNRIVTETFTAYADGVTRKYDYIYLGSSGGSSVRIRMTCANSSAQITASLVSYSW